MTSTTLVVLTIVAHEGRYLVVEERDGTFYLPAGRVEPGELDPEHVHVPGIFVQRVVLAPRGEKRIEKRTVAVSSAGYPSQGTERQTTGQQTTDQAGA